MKWKMMLILMLASLLLAAPVAQAEKLLCVTNQNLKGTETVNTCLAKGRGLQWWTILVWCGS